MEVYTPSHEQLEFAHRNAREPINKLGILVLLKTFQRLGYFATLSQVPQPVIQHIACCTGLTEAVAGMKNYEESGSRRKHIPAIRELLEVRAFRDGGEQVMNAAMTEACQTRDILADIINAGIEELVRQRYELPGFSTLHRAALEARARINGEFYQSIYDSLSQKQKRRLQKLLWRGTEETVSGWERLKQEPKRVTVKNMRDLMDHLHWLRSLDVVRDALNSIPESKMRRFSHEARSLNIAQMNEMEETKRLTLAAAMAHTQAAQAIDDLTDMFIRSVRKLHNHGRDIITERTRKRPTA
jgi:hypothetical protein